MDATNLYICYELDWWSRDIDTDFTLGNCLFESVKVTKNADPDEHKYSGYGLGFDSRSEFSCLMEVMGKMLSFSEFIWAQLCMLIIREKLS